MEKKKTINLTRYIRPAAALLLGAAVLGSSGCVKRDLDIKGSVEIALDWGGDPRPQTARFLFYDESGALIRDVDGITDKYVGLFPAGTYRLVVYNTDAFQVGYRGVENYGTAEVFAQQTDYSGGHHPSEGVPCIQEPREVFGTGRCKEFETLEVLFAGSLSATVRPVELTKKVRMHFIVNTDQTVRSLTGVLNGVAPGVFFSSLSCNSASSCAIEFTAQPAAAAAADDPVISGLGYTAQINVFDLLTRSGSAAGTNTMSVVLTIEDGTQATDTFDLTETLKQILSANGGVLPADIPVEVTFHMQSTDLEVTVKPWDDSGTGSGSPRPQA